MIVRSVEEPEVLEVIEQGHKAELVFRYDIQEIDGEDDGYEYEEIRLETKNRQGLKELVELEYDEWLLKAQEANGVDDASNMAAEILELSEVCSKNILSGFTSSATGEEKQYDCEMTDQASIQGLAITAMMGLSGMTTEETHWKGTGELECYNFEYEQILVLATDMKNHIQCNIDGFNAKRKEVYEKYGVSTD